MTDRRHLLRRALSTLATLAVPAATIVAPAPAAAQAWPAKPVRLIVPAAAGAAPDVIARLLAERLGAAWGQSLIVDNRPGAGGIPGMSALARSANDGYTLGFVPAAMGTITPLVYRNPQFNPETELTSVATVGTSPLVLVTAAGSGITSLTDLAKAAKARPGQLNFAAPQPNSLPHLAGELMAKSGNLALYTVPYPGPPQAVSAVLAGDVTLTADGLPGLLPHIRAGRLKALAVTSGQRLPGLDIPTVAETFPGYELVGWFQILAPTGTPQPVIDKVNAEVNRILATPEIVSRLGELGIYPRRDSVAGAREFFASQQKAMRRLVAELGVQAQ
ncbi:MAG: hypothetical protein RLY78_1097 [Pseudomonadota bacterium]|uniref:Tripartite tricarboxylate transporter substrate-binding protein n=1 Tax=Pseudaquabacterium rugosum TaxID=2984194 RepID=A0ABU9BAA9_9BURK